MGATACRHGSGTKIDAQVVASRYWPLGLDDGPKIHIVLIHFKTNFASYTDFIIVNTSKLSFCTSIPPTKAQAKKIRRYSNGLVLALSNCKCLKAGAISDQSAERHIKTLKLKLFKVECKLR